LALRERVWAAPSEASERVALDRRLVPEKASANLAEGLGVLLGLPIRCMNDFKRWIDRRQD
jgi:hypothetical protein